MSLLIRYLILKLNLIDKKFAVLIPILLMITAVISITCVLLFTIIILNLFPSNEFSTGNLIGNIFNLGLVFLIWTLIYASFLFFESQQKLAQQKLNLSLQLKEAELNNLRKQLSPHFLFNAINNIRSLILINPEKARDALLDVSDLLRYALNYQKKKSVTVAEEMEIVMGYINLNKIHLGKNVNFEIEIKDSLKTLDIPPMSIQLLVENAIKHGALIDGGLVSVIATEEAGYRLIQVSNPGQLKSSNADGIGLKNLKQRLNSMYLKKAEFIIYEKHNMVNAQIKIS